MQSFESYLEQTKEVGFVDEIRPPILRVNGLPGASIDEVILFESGGYGLVLDLEEDYIDVLKIRGGTILIGERAVRSGNRLSTLVSENMIGKMVDPFGNIIQEIISAQQPPQVGVPNSIDTLSIKPAESRDIHSVVAPINKRSQITKTFFTGVAVVDLMLPIGHGQRELVVGDRKTGKSEFLLQVLSEQSSRGNICIYSCIGKRKSDIFRVVNFIKENNLKNVIIVKSLSNEELGTIFITPYSSMAMAEYFRDIGRDVVLILDDLSTHAKFYRELSLISEKFPGRSSYPGDIFYRHARLLERAGNFLLADKEASITCFPVAESPAGDISGYIPTNLMSITDGHLFFDNDLFEKGRRPAINYFLSVTRVGRQTQTKLMWSVNREITSFLGLLSKTEDFIHFGAEMNEGIKSTMKMGEKIQTFLNQDLGIIRKLNAQVITFCLIWSGMYKDDPTADVNVFAEKISHKYISDKEFSTLVDTLINSSEDLNALLSQVGAKSVEILKYVQ